MAEIEISPYIIRGRLGVSRLGAGEQLVSVRLKARVGDGVGAIHERLNHVQSHSREFFRIRTSTVLVCMDDTAIIPEEIQPFMKNKGIKPQRIQLSTAATASSASSLAPGGAKCIQGQHAAPLPKVISDELVEELDGRRPLFRSWRTRLSNSTERARSTATTTPPSDCFATDECRVSSVAGYHG